MPIVVRLIVSGVGKEDVWSRRGRERGDGEGEEEDGESEEGAGGGSGALDIALLVLSGVVMERGERRRQKWAVAMGAAKHGYGSRLLRWCI